jgi:hypothetical protein
LYALLKWAKSLTDVCLFLVQLTYTIDI